MAVKILQRKNSDFIGAFASGLCLIHCIATPFIFIAQTCSATCCNSSPSWWKLIDFIFIIISFIAIYFSARQSSKSWIKVSLYTSWSLLLLAIVNERLDWFNFHASIIYIPALALIGLHLYNKKNYKCNNDECFVTKD